ncbi:MAG TPA: sigma factor, partial [Burkholderiales bacterium]|nr:sigma factor [Burkholderiales bacterium]
MTDRARYEALVLPHLDAAYNLARWLTRNDHDAEDVLQEAMLRAYRHFDGLRGEARPWLLAIVR